MTIVDDELTARRRAASEEATGVQTDDAADDTPEPDEPEAEAPEVEQRPPKPMQIALPGTIEGIPQSPGGSAPTSSEARLMGGSLPIDGSFDGEEYVELVVTAKVAEVDFVYTTDDWGNTKNVKRRHKMRLISVRRA